MTYGGDDSFGSLPLFANLTRDPEDDEPEAEPARDGRRGRSRRSGRRDRAAPAPEAVAANEPRAEAVAADSPAAPQPGSRDAPWPVSQVVKRASHALDRAVGTVWVEGEVASLSRPASGHLYFTLKDDRSVLRAVMWRSDARRLKFRLEDGMSLRCRGRLGIYQQGGKFQLYAQLAEPAGLGAEALALEQLRRALAAEGLFDTARKRPLPRLPRRIGVVTSRTGAAVRDVVRAVQRRFPVPILVADTRVQGRGAPAQIVAALHQLYRTDVDVVIVGRGGGSADDLAAYNDEAVARCVAACPVPTISAVGHEVDTSLTDLVADRRAATPTMAGEMAVPVQGDLAAALAKEERRLQREVDLILRSARQDLDRHLQRAHHRTHVAVSSRRQLLADLRRGLDQRHPRARLVAHRGELRDLEARARALSRAHLDRGQRAFAALAGRLEALSPLRVLERGYALATADGHVLTDADRVTPGDEVEVKLARGALACRVDRVDPATAAPATGARGDADPPDQR